MDFAEHFSSMLMFKADAAMGSDEGHAGQYGCGQ